MFWVIFTADNSLAWPRAETLLCLSFGRGSGRRRRVRWRRALLCNLGQGAERRSICVRLAEHGVGVSSYSCADLVNRARVRCRVEVEREKEQLALTERGFSGKKSEVRQSSDFLCVELWRRTGAERGSNAEAISRDE